MCSLFYAHRVCSFPVPGSQKLGSRQRPVRRQPCQLPGRPDLLHLGEEPVLRRQLAGPLRTVLQQEVPRLQRRIRRCQDRLDLSWIWPLERGS